MWAPVTTNTDETRITSIPHSGAPEFASYPRTAAPAPPAIAPPAAPVAHPAFTGAVRFQQIARPADDERATADTIGLMARMIREDSQHPIVIAAADQATAGIPDGQIERAIAAVHRWVKSHVRFVQDSALAASLSGFVPEETEVLIRPADLLAMPQPQGDCDDYAMAAGAILAALGIPVALVTIAGDPATPNTYSHVYLLAAAPNGAIAVDASHGPRSSWYAPAAGKAKIWEVQPVITRAPGLGAIDWNSIIQTGVKAGAQIATNVTMPSGTYQQAGPQGTVVYRQPEGANALSFPTTQLSGSFSPILALAAIGGIVLLLATRSRG